MNNFTTARTKLTLWYLGILFFIISAFSLVLYTTENQNFTRVVLLRDYGTKLPKKLTNFEKREIRAQIMALRQVFSFNLFLIDGIILLIGGSLSYAFAGKTLEPIQQVLQKQKDFLADASHELRTPLSAIQTACEVVLRNSHKTKEDYKKVVEQTYAESMRLGRLAENLLMLSRFELGNIELQFVTCDLQEVLNKAIAEIKPLADKNNLTIFTQLESVLLVTGDKDKLQQLFLILLHNAVKYTPARGTITVRLTGQPRPTVNIVDTGVGIAVKDKKRIFERFYQADTSRTTSGAGLGLPIAKLIANAHKAKILVESEVGHGSTFSVIF